tara:strand:+ start:242 stop:868 length:627 start_codon:yes stop_codon:yes gene_type:complete
VEIREISIPEIHIPEIHIPYSFLPNYDHSNVEVIGCTYYHRDTKNTGNRNLLLDDPNGVISNCPYPSFYPLNYQADQLIIVEETAPINEKPNTLPEGKPPQAEIPKNKKEEDIFKPCPPKNAPFREGDFKNELRLERLLKYERDIDGSCNAIWEEVPFIDQYIPQPSTIVSTAVIASVAATTPIILNLVKPIVKNLIKKLTKKKNKLK